MITCVTGRTNKRANKTQDITVRCCERKSKQAMATTHIHHIGSHPVYQCPQHKHTKYTPNVYGTILGPTYTFKLQTYKPRHLFSSPKLINHTICLQAPNLQKHTICLQASHLQRMLQREYVDNPKSPNTI